MFRRVSNIDLLNKILELENKIDIYVLKSSDDNIICCNCKVKELIIYKEIKEYFEDKFRDIQNNLKQLEKQDKLNNFLENYKNEILTNFENIISKLEIIKNNETANFDKIKDIRKLLSDDNIYTQLNTISNKIDLLYYENEIIKHQLLLEEDIRKCEQEVNILSDIINKTLNN
jgi:hypothetical protein